MQCYSSENPAVFVAIPAGIESLLDVGCGTGALMKWVRSTIGPRVHLEGITYSEEEASQAANVADKGLVRGSESLRFPSIGQIRLYCV